MYVYIVAIKRDSYYEGISKTGYKTLSEAQKFIESRSDNPKKRNDFKYVTDEYVYEIIEVRIWV